MAGADSGVRLEAAQRLFDRVRRVLELAPRYRDLADIANLADLERMPVLTKDDLAATYSEVVALAGDQPAYVFASGGSTGQPKVSYLPADFFTADIAHRWRPLGHDDLFLNAYAAGRLWSSHYFHNEFARRAGSRIVPLGGIEDDEVRPWVRFCRQRRVTAIGATPTTLRAMLTRAAADGIGLPALRAVLWVGEAWDTEVDTALSQVAPWAGRWGLYGSTETWVIGTNTPSCPADVFHPLPYQYVQIQSDGMLDVTCLHPAALNLLLRYQPGDAAEFVRCRCGAAEPAVRVLGRRDGVVKFRGALLHVDHMVEEISGWPGVRRAQLVVVQADGRQPGLEVRLIVTPGAQEDLPDQLRRHLLGGSLDLGNLFTGDPHAFRVRVVESLATTRRSAKTPHLVWA